MHRLTKDEYCVKCANTGVLPDGSPCDCRVRMETFYDTVSCLDVPDQYRGIIFNKFLLPKDMPDYYSVFMTDLHDSIIKQQWRNHNVCVCSPVGHGKSVLAYSCIEQLFRAGVLTFPVYDALEIKRIMIDMDMCRKQLHDVANPEYVNIVPYLFVKIPRMVSWEIYDVIISVLDRRVRRGVCTIFLYDGTWEQLIKKDTSGILTGIQGDGTYTTLDVKSFYSTAVKTAPEVQLADNLG